jgi:hypothetical protein
MADIGLSAFSVFFMGRPSQYDYRRNCWTFPERAGIEPLPGQEAQPDSSVRVPGTAGLYRSVGV